MAELQDEVTQKNFKVNGMSKIFLNNIFELGKIGRFEFGKVKCVIGKGEKVKGKRKVKAVVTNCGFDHFKLKPWLVTTVSKHFRKIKP